MGRSATILAMSITTPLDETPVRNRTRHAILNAAIAVLTARPAASLGEIADEAGVARSTLHRYFPDRVSLLAALNDFADEEVRAAMARARMNDGPAAEALIRLLHEYFDAWHNITWQYLERERQGQQDCDDDLHDEDLGALIQRGFADGTIDPSLTNSWLQQMLWAVIYSSWEGIRYGSNRVDALKEAERTLLKIIRP